MCNSLRVKRQDSPLGASARPFLHSWPVSPKDRQPDFREGHFTALSCELVIPKGQQSIFEFYIVQNPRVYMPSYLDFFF